MIIVTVRPDLDGQRAFGRCLNRSTLAPILLVMSTCLLTATGRGFAQQADVPAQFEQHGGTLERDTLETYVDALVASRMEEHHIVGATVAIVHGGEVVLSKGYGYADLETRRPVKAEQTLFRVGSISKTLTFTGVMQLVEQGRIDLDADIRDYLTSVDLVLSFDEPLSMRHLMAHTPGFEDRTFGHLWRDPEQILSITDYLRRYQPKQVRAPGETIAYSNYGADAARRMQTQHFSMAPSMPGFAHGFMVGDTGGYPSIGHSGGTLFFMSDMHLIPELEFGLFVSTNTDSGWNLAEDLADLVVERFFPRPSDDDVAQRIDPKTEERARFAGSYLGSRRSYTRIDRLVTVGLIRSSISVSDDGNLISDGLIGADTWEPIGQTRFRSVSDGSEIAFIEGENGQTVLVVARMIDMVFEKVGLLSNGFVLYAVLLISALVFVGALVAAGFRAKRVRQAGVSSWTRAAQISALAAGGTWVAAIAAFIVGALSLLGGWEALFFAFPPAGFRVGAIIAVLAAALTLLAVFGVPVAWSEKTWPVFRRVRHTGFVALLVLVTIILADLSAVGLQLSS